MDHRCGGLSHTRVAGFVFLWRPGHAFLIFHLVSYLAKRLPEEDGSTDMMQALQRFRST